MSTNKDAECLKAFKELTEAALRETDTDAFMELLLQREVSAMYLMKNNAGIDGDETEGYLLMENEILKRLEKERNKLLKEMEVFSIHKKAARQYTSKYPFPPMPVFFEKEG